MDGRSVYWHGINRDRRKRRLYDMYTDRQSMSRRASLDDRFFARILLGSVDTCGVSSKRRAKFSDVWWWKNFMKNKKRRRKKKFCRENQWSVLRTDEQKHPVVWCWREKENIPWRAEIFAVTMRARNKRTILHRASTQHNSRNALEATADLTRRRE